MEVLQWYKMSRQPLRARDHSVMEDLLPTELYVFLLQNGLSEDVSREFVNNEITGEGKTVIIRDGN